MHIPFYEHLNCRIRIELRLIDSVPAISVITEIELLCWKAPVDEDLKVLHDFIKDAYIFDLEHAIKLRTAEIRKSHKIKLPDAVIAATAVIHNLTLLTRNTSDFKSIRGLNIINPHEQ